MIQPIGAFSPRADFRGRRTADRTPQERSKAQVAMINATGISALVGAVTTAIARNQTTSWANAGILGVFASILAMFFMAPRLIENTTLMKHEKKTNRCADVAKETASTHSTIKNELKIPKRIQFRQQS